MKRLLLKAMLMPALALLLACWIVSPGYAASTHHRSTTGIVKPQAVGGGCSSWTFSDSKDIKARACLNYVYPFLLSSADIYFYPQGVIHSCYIALILYTPKNVPVNSVEGDCTSSVNGGTRQGSVRFPTAYTSFGAFYSEVYIDIEYQNYNYSVMGADSPIQTTP